MMYKQSLTFYYCLKFKKNQSQFLCTSFHLLGIERRESVEY